ncbi:membrane protein insertase YidC [Carnobacterium pleistocenium]|uniref:membrane protein insertase YidC n=1 Tax=Carnobacterium pleistocenium TaxID=181073 RepID=UPI000A5261FE|nr:membrane protein insertase YidC [Carnobacterium pleistocenium]
MKNFKKLLLSGTLLSVVFFLSGCMGRDSDGNPSGTIYELLVVPTQRVIIQLADLFGGSYGLSIIAITLAVRLIILPLNLSQSKKSIIQQEKMAMIKPEMDEVQKKQKAAVSAEEKAAAQQELMSLYKDNNMSMLGGIGCLPLLIQMPIFTAMFQAISLSKEIGSSTFLGFSLGDQNIALAIAAGAVYFVQSYVSMIGLPDEQKKQMRTMMYVSPIMILMVSFTSPAGLGLYWFVGGVFAVFQTLITNFIFKPRIRAQLEEEAKKRPVKPKRTIKQAEPVEQKTKELNQPSNNKNTHGRNAGKQQNKR